MKESILFQSSSSGTILPAYQLPHDPILTTATNVNLALAAANAAYSVRFRLPVGISFSKAAINQASGAVAGINVVYALYTMDGSLLCQIKFTTVNPGGAAVTLNGTLTPSNVTIPPGIYDWMIAEDAVPASGTVLGIGTTLNFFTQRNVFSFANCFKVGVLSGGNFPSTINISTFTKLTTGHMGSNSVGIVEVSS